MAVIYRVKKNEGQRAYLRKIARVRRRNTIEDDERLLMFGCEGADRLLFTKIKDMYLQFMILLVLVIRSHLLYVTLIFI